MLRIDGVIYMRDLVIDRGRVRVRKKKPSRRFRADYGHTPLSVEEKTPGSAVGWWWAPAPRRPCRSWMTFGERRSGAE
ncbi:MAG TPA: hypothetical protein VGU71_06560 [Candidatus Dormibacteraeota bacterium]|nr:hypothetical protein [Candidatus Dormibacteraeota bacterium]